MSWKQLGANLTDHPFSATLQTVLKYLNSKSPFHRDKTLQKEMNWSQNWKPYVLFCGPMYTELRRCSVQWCQTKTQGKKKGKKRSAKSRENSQDTGKRHHSCWQLMKLIWNQLHYQVSFNGCFFIYIFYYGLYGSCSFHLLQALNFSSQSRSYFWFQSEMASSFN